MRINVTQEDIKEGVTRDSSLCPVARAICRACKLKPSEVCVDGTEFDYTGDMRSPLYLLTPVRLPVEVDHFVTAFDDERKVLPFAFELDVPAPTGN